MIFDRILSRIRRLADFHGGEPRKAPLEQRFTTLYEAGGWAGPLRLEPISGSGSSLQNTVDMRNAICEIAVKLFKDERTLRIVDAPCGDMTFMPELLKALAARFVNVEYVGIDVVEPLIAENRKLPLPASNVAWEFRRMDITADNIPACHLFFCKDLVNHLRDRDIFRLIANLQKSRCEYAMITSNTGCTNEELPSDAVDASRHVDLQKPPYGLVNPIYDDRYLVLWKLPFDLSQSTRTIG